MNIEQLEARIFNLEKALCALACAIYDLQPPSTQEDIDLIMDKLYEAAVSLGRDESGGFKLGK